MENPRLPCVRTYCCDSSVFFLMFRPNAVGSNTPSHFFSPYGEQLIAVWRSKLKAFSYEALAGHHWVGGEK